MVRRIRAKILYMPIQTAHCQLCWMKWAAYEGYLPVVTCLPNHDKLPTETWYLHRMSRICGRFWVRILIYRAATSTLFALFCVLLDKCTANNTTTIVLLVTVFTTKYKTFHLLFKQCAFMPEGGGIDLNMYHCWALLDTTNCCLWQ